MTHEATIPIESRAKSNESGIVVRLSGKGVDGCVRASIHAGQLAKNCDRLTPKRGFRIRLANWIACALVSDCVRRLVRVQHRRREQMISVYIRRSGSSE